mgnify:CR=1 FL=1
MKTNLVSLLAAAVMAAAFMTSCSSNDSDNNNSSDKMNIYGYSEFSEKFADIADIPEGPQLTLSNTTAKAGGIAEVTLSVSNADLKWNMCGIHVTFPDVFDCVLKNEEERLVEFQKGTALEFATGVVSMEWQEGLPEELINAHQGCVFITAMFNGDYGQDGDIATFYFQIPETAAVGAIYNVDLYYQSTDIFSNTAGSAEFEKYAFEHAIGGTVTIE